MCVGRGYINDPERTAAAYLTDPHRPGERLYQAGDFGRWRPDGKLEFLGRRDSQVKISGFRIEIGEIENTLLRVPGVRDGAVVVAEPAGGAKHLVAFYAADRPLPLELLRDRLGASLPGYMVPKGFHWRETLPLTANSKIDKKALTSLAAELDVDDEDVGAAGHGHRAAAGRRVGHGARGAGRAGRASGPLLRHGRDVAVGGEGGDRAQARGVAEGDHPLAGACRSRRADRRQAGRSRRAGCRAADRAAAGPQPSRPRPGPQRWSASPTPVATR